MRKGKIFSLLSSFAPGIEIAGMQNITWATQNTWTQKAILEAVYLTDKSQVLSDTPNKKPILDKDKELKNKNITTREIEAGPPDVGDDAWLPS